MAKAHLEVSGLVQGVGFRWYVRVAARRLSLAGWVANRPDGTVEIAAEGDEDSVVYLRQMVSAGPPGARVETIIDLEDVAEVLPSPFIIRNR